MPSARRSLERLEQMLKVEVGAHYFVIGRNRVACMAAPGWLQS